MADLGSLAQDQDAEEIRAQVPWAYQHGGSLGQFAAGPPQAGAPGAPPSAAAPAYTPANTGASAGPAPLAFPNRGPQALPSFGPQAVSPAHFQPVSRAQTVQQGIPVSPEVKEAYEQLDVARKEQLSSGLELSSQQAQADAERARQKAILDKADADADRMRRDQQRLELTKYKQHMDDSLAAANDARIDPMKWWHDQNAGAKFFTGLSMIMRGFNFGFSGKGSSPTDWVNQQIAQSVQAQQAQFSQKAKVAESAGNLYASMRQQFGDDDRAALASGLIQRQSIMSHLDSQIADQQLPAVERMRAGQLKLELAKDQAADHEALDAKTADKITTQSSEHFVPAQASDPIASATRRIKEVTDYLRAKGVLSDVMQGGGSPEDQKLWAETQKTMGEASKLRAETSGAVTTEALGKVASEFSQKSIGGAEAALSKAEDLVAKGAAGFGSQIVAGKDFVGDALAGSSGRELHGALRDVAASLVHAQGGRPSPEAIDAAMKSIVGMGTEGDIKNGLARVRSFLGGEKSNILSGTSPQVAAEYERRNQAAGVGLPAGVVRGPLP